jgi:hypothetical protein
MCPSTVICYPLQRKGLKVWRWWGLAWGVGAFEARVVVSASFRSTQKGERPSISERMEDEIVFLVGEKTVLGKGRSSETPFYSGFRCG